MREFPVDLYKGQRPGLTSDSLETSLVMDTDMVIRLPSRSALSFNSNSVQGKVDSVRDYLILNF